MRRLGLGSACLRSLSEYKLMDRPRHSLLVQTLLEVFNLSSSRQELILHAHLMKRPLTLLHQHMQRLYSPHRQHQGHTRNGVRLQAEQNVLDANKLLPLCDQSNELLHMWTLMPQFGVDLVPELKETVNDTQSFQGFVNLPLPLNNNPSRERASRLLFQSRENNKKNTTTRRPQTHTHARVSFATIACARAKSWRAVGVLRPCLRISLTTGWNSSSLSRDQIMVCNF